MLGKGEEGDSQEGLGDIRRRSVRSTGGPAQEGQPSSCLLLCGPGAGGAPGCGCGHSARLSVSAPSESEEAGEELACCPARPRPSSPSRRTSTTRLCSGCPAARKGEPPRRTPPPTTPSLLTRRPPEHPPPRTLCSPRKHLGLKLPVSAAPSTSRPSAPPPPNLRDFPSHPRGSSRVSRDQAP
ncbi:leukocyte-specific transcript 1 protein isoform X1 [Pipistrellus kuhlii]|uniref:leukocyte-specific transcript 1 protein isoform X1 n=1 Tax=Pipistrellus kuhlii TaxID=59472 RepID=UPI001E26E9EB|nr:leukocyte-specific transcript 1 protein isoform X1 [Pipistrellus kuhlii]